jgi:hypothetical protein
MIAYSVMRACTDTTSHSPTTEVRRCRLTDRLDDQRSRTLCRTHAAITEDQQACCIHELDSGHRGALCCFDRCACAPSPSPTTDDAHALRAPYLNVSTARADHSDLADSYLMTSTSEAREWRLGCAPQNHSSSRARRDRAHRPERLSTRRPDQLETATSSSMTLSMSINCQCTP